MGGLDAEMTESAGQMTFLGDPAKRQRGPYRSVNTGISYGGGSKVRGISAQDGGEWLADFHRCQGSSRLWARQTARQLGS